ncbi:MAG: hypothetical protein ABIJ20_03395 [Nanoarchaeota archaeon]|nr:hypothetical protein [Nanoarchaeota archaeon]MBU1445446.1 hypothetical protein [Nanoarchaeota archaeon]MBU2406976.1 hypothetical protein [Nanoarchaeota archaeon]MBU2420254.1 hypothetical protein [Nanoarchaeota archaeon]MBU2474983.1 hypothetical protein [Nanoarchaeota archaeon]
MKKTILMLVFIFCIFFVEASITDQMTERVSKVLVERIKVNTHICDKVPNCDCIESGSFYCEDGELIEDCFKCGCPNSYICEPEGRGCILENGFKIEQTVGIEEQVILDRLVGEDEFTSIRLIPISFLGSNNLVMNFDLLKITLSLDLFGKPAVDFELKEKT